MTELRLGVIKKWRFAQNDELFGNALCRYYILGAIPYAYRIHHPHRQRM
jgi:hypothetical protein